MATNREILAAAFPLHYQRIAECTRPELFNMQYEGAEPGILLRCMFVYGDTVEGHRYWTALDNGANYTPGLI